MTGSFLVRAALRRPVTVMVAILAAMLAAVFAVQKTPRDILPNLGIPVIYVAQPYGGMDPSQMEGYLTYYYEYHFLYITGIEHVESKNIQGTALVKLQFHPGTNMAQAMAETITQVNRARAFMPPGTVPPFVMRFDTGSVPVGNLVFSSDTRSVGELQYYALNFVRPLFATLPGVSAPPPFGGNQRTIVVNVDPDRLRARHLSPEDVVAAVGQSNLLAPSGNVRIGDAMPMVPTNTTVRDIRELENVPIRPGADPAVFLRDVAGVENGTDIPTGYALVNGRRTVYIPVTKRADASTLAVVDLVRQNLPKFQSVLPADVKVSYEFDQSPLVTGALGGLIQEGILGALLTGLVVLLFLRDVRSALVVVLNIPLSILAALLALWVAGETVNLMTLGGLALAVGILVDEATVTIENVHAHLARGAAPARAALDATAETAVPRLLAMLCVLAVFIPSFFMAGAARALFVPLSLAVGFSMFASYLLSSTLVPVLAAWGLRPHAGSKVRGPKSQVPGAESEDRDPGKSGPETPPTASSSFAALRDRYARAAGAALRRRGVVTAAYVVLAGLVIAGIGSWLGSEIFPRAQAGQFQLRLRASAGTRIERTEAIALETLDEIKKEIGADGVELSLGFVGVQAPSYPINTIYLWTGGPEEAVLQVQVRGGSAVAMDDLQERLRRRLAARLPDVSFSFEPSDLVSRVMSLGSPTPVEVAVSGPSLADDRAHAEKVRAALAQIPSLRDLRYGQSLDYPTLEVMVDRERAGLMGATPADVTRAVIPATSSSRFTTPNYWADPATGIAFQIQVVVPTSRMSSAEEVRNIPVSRKGGESLLLRDVAGVRPGTTAGEIDRYNMQRMVTLTANVSGEDLGRAAARVKRIVEEAGRQAERESKEIVRAGGKAPPPVSFAVRGQIAAMEQLFGGLRSGLLLTVVVIALLLAAAFQSWRLALVIVSTVPAGLAGVVLALGATGTTVNVQSFIGGIMAIGVAVANAILLVTFAERARMGGASAAEAALEGARSRLRPVLMTSLAMIAGMIPLALGLGEGGAQTAPLGRAVIGGLAAATVATLFVLPAVFAVVMARTPARSASLEPDIDINISKSR